MRLVQMVRGCALSLAILVCVDGLSSYVTAFLRIFRHKVMTGRRGRPRLVLEPGFLMGQVIMRREKRHLVEVAHRVVHGSMEAIGRVLSRTGTGTGINTAYIERLNATFRSALAALTKRGRYIAHLPERLTAGMYLVDCAYNFCWEHDSLPLTRAEGDKRTGQARTPAMAAGLTDRRWTINELLQYRVTLRAQPLSTRRPRRHTQDQQHKLWHVA